MIRNLRFFLLPLLFLTAIFPSDVRADSVNSPNITLNVDTHRATSTGAGAGNTSFTVNTITLAETTLPEYSSGTGKSFSIKAKPGYQFDPSSNVTAQSATIGLNGGAINAVATVTPTGAADEVIIFNLTSGTNTGVQDIIRINGIKVRIISPAGAAGPAQTTLTITTSTAGGAFNNQGIVAANITKGAAHHLSFANQPASSVAGGDLLPSVKIVDFGENIITNDQRTITLSIITNPGSATLLGATQRASFNGLSTWVDSDDLNITSAANGYVLQASHSGAAFLGSDTANSNAFNISAGNPGSMSITTQPTETAAGEDITLSVSLLDQFGNTATTSGINIALDSAVNPGGWPLLVDTSLTKATVNGVASWGADDNLRITKAITGYQLSVSGLGAPLTTNTFNIVPGSPILLKFTQQPSDVKDDTSMSPVVSVETTDIFGNRTSSSVAIALAADTSACNDGIKNNEAASVSGLATFDSLTLGTPCAEVSLLATSSGFVGATSNTFAVRAKDEFPIAVKSSQLKKGKLFQFSSTGDFTISKVAIDDPTKRGATLTVTGTTGSVRYSLPKSGWQKVGSKGFKFSNAKCQNVTVTNKTIRAVCAAKTGSIKLPETELGIILEVGKGTQRFCGNCGGNSVGNETKTFKRTDCAAETFCPNP